jgi:hypothetical protein
MIGRPRLTDRCKRAVPGADVMAKIGGAKIIGNTEAIRSR